MDDGLIIRSNANTFETANIWATCDTLQRAIVNATRKCSFFGGVGDVWIKLWKVGFMSALMQSHACFIDKIVLLFWNDF